MNDKKSVGISDRQIRRIVKESIENGDIGVMHKSFGRESNNKILNFDKSKILALYRQKYNGYSPTFAS